MRRMSKLFAPLATFGTAVAVFLSANPAFAQATDAVARRSRQVAGPGRRARASACPRWAAASVRDAPPARAVEGISRNPQASNKIFTPMILGLALIESLVIYGLVIAFLLYGKIG